MPGDFFSSGASTSSAMSTRWLTEEVFKLIDIVQKEEAIYNPRHKYYFCRPYVENFWREVDMKLEKNPGASLAKWTNLRISFRREYTNYLEEKVPPCWTYFDRMFFLHPYLRRKHQHPKSLDAQVQDALVHINSLSSRYQRERSATTTANSATGHIDAEYMHSSNSGPHKRVDSYLEYIDEPDQNNSELDEIIDEDQMRFPNLDVNFPHNDIKSECDDNVEDYDAEHRNEDDRDVEDSESLNAIVDPIATSSVVKDKRPNKSTHRNRLPTRSFYDDVLPKRPRQSVELVSTTTNNPVSSNDYEVNKPLSEAKPSTSTIPNSSSTLHRQLQLHHQRLEISSGNVTIAGGSSSNNISAPSHVDLCDCKSDPDAMFLMSLLPDIQKLNGRDRGKIKIAFQNILQNFLYPD